MSYVILDLEWNGSYSNKEHRYVNEIIEFGAVKTDENFNIVDRFEMLVAPQIGKKLCSKVKKLTNLTNEELRNKGCTFMHAVSEFTKFSDGCTLITWGTSDILALIENYSYYTHKRELPFLKNYCDVQVYCENCLSFDNKMSQLGLTTCAEMLAIAFDEGEQHRAYADAELTLKCLKVFIDDNPIDSYIEDASVSQFYERITFKNHFITNIDNPDVDKRKMRFHCDCCGRQASRQTQWRVRNKSFTAEFKCKGCGRSFIGRISFKKKYDCVLIKKRIAPDKKEDKQQENKSEIKC